MMNHAIIAAPVAASCDVEAVTLTGNESQTHHFDTDGREIVGRRELRRFHHLTVLEPVLTLAPDTTPLRTAAGEALEQINNRRRVRS